MIKKYRKKPVVIEAICLSDYEGIFELRQALEDLNGDRETLAYHDGSVAIKTLEGTMKASPDDYIIKGVQGEFYPCKPDIFQQTYEEVE